MSVDVRVHNKAGEWIDQDRPCFGFMSFIDQWDEDDINEASSNDIYDRSDYGNIPGFESCELTRLDHSIWRPFEDNDFGKKQREEYFEKFLEALPLLPQYFEGVEVLRKDASHQQNEDSVTFCYPLEGRQMQATIIGAMMVRNIMCYSCGGKAFGMFIDKGVEPHIAFVLANTYFGAFQPMARGGIAAGNYFYRTYGGDESIFNSLATVADVAAMINGKLANPWQGKWGDTDEGYGRYGNYDSHSAGNNPRTNMQKNLNDVTLLLDGYQDSPKLSRNEWMGGAGQNHIPESFMMETIIPAIREAL